MGRRKLTRRSFLKAGALSAAFAASPGRSATSQIVPEGMNRTDLPTPKADACILIWLPGGVAQNETWDPKPFTPYERGMKASAFRSTCRSIPTSADGIYFGEGLEEIASVMHLGAVVRSLSEPTDIVPVHLECISQMHTGYKFPSGFKAPSLGAILSRTLGRRHPDVPAYVDIGRSLESSHNEDKFLSIVVGSGFYPQKFGPFEVGDPLTGAQLLERLAGMTKSDIERRAKYRRALSESGPLQYSDESELARYVDIVDEAVAIMDSPIRDSFGFSDAMSKEELSAYGYLNPHNDMAKEGFLCKIDERGKRFESGCLLARRLIESGVRFVEVEFPYRGFCGFDTHLGEGSIYPGLKKRVDVPISRLIRDLEERGLLQRTLVVVASEFGRTISGVDSGNSKFSQPEHLSVNAARSAADSIVFDEPHLYGFHAHLRTWSALLFGGGVPEGFVYGKTADEHPMVAVQDPVSISDLHATIFHLLGLKPDVYFMDGTRPVYITDNGEGKPIRALVGQV